MAEYYKNKDLEPIIYEENGILKKEIWKDIPGFSCYEASDLGRIKSKTRVIKDSIGRIKNKKGRVLTARNKIGYLLVHVKNDKNFYSYYPIHRLVMAAFKGCSDLQVDHINRDKTHNTLNNLRYCTSRENSHFYVSSLNTKTNSIGVTKNSKSYSARISIKGSYYALGNFKTKKEAQEAYRSALHKWENMAELPEPIDRNYMSKHIGITYNKKRHIWHARITIEGHRYYTGHFKSEEEALNSQTKAKHNWEEYKVKPYNRKSRNYE